DKRQELVFVDAFFPCYPANEAGDRGIGVRRCDRIILSAWPVYRAGDALVVDVALLVDLFDLVSLLVTFLALVEHRPVDGRDIGEGRCCGEGWKQGQGKQVSPDHAASSQPQNAGSHFAGSSPNCARSA